MHQASANLADVLGGCWRGHPVCPGGLFPGPPEALAPALPVLFSYPPVHVCVCLPCDIGSNNFPPGEILVVHVLLEWISKCFPIGGAEAVTKWFSVALTEQLSTAVINGKYQQEPGCGLFNRMESGDTSSVLYLLLPFSTWVFVLSALPGQNMWKSPDTASIIYVNVISESCSLIDINHCQNLICIFNTQNIVVNFNSEFGMRCVGIQRFRFRSKKPPWVLAWNVYLAQGGHVAHSVAIAHVKYQGTMKLNARPIQKI